MVWKQLREKIPEDDVKEVQGEDGERTNSGFDAFNVTANAVLGN